MKLQPLYPHQTSLQRKTGPISSRAFFQAWAGSPYKPLILFEVIYLKDKYNCTTTQFVPLDRCQNSILGIRNLGIPEPSGHPTPPDTLLLSYCQGDWCSTCICGYFVPEVRYSNTHTPFVGSSGSPPSIDGMGRICVQSGLLPLALTGHDRRTGARFEAGGDRAHQPILMISIRSGVSLIHQLPHKYYLINGFECRGIRESPVLERFETIRSKNLLCGVP